MSMLHSIVIFASEHQRLPILSLQLQCSHGQCDCVTELEFLSATQLTLKCVGQQQSGPVPCLIHENKCWTGSPSKAKDRRTS